MSRFAIAIVPLTLMLAVSWSTAQAARHGSAFGGYEPYDGPPCPELEDRCSDYYGETVEQVVVERSTVLSSQPVERFDVASLIVVKTDFVMPGVVVVEEPVRTEFVTRDGVGQPFSQFASLFNKQQPQSVQRFISSFDIATAVTAVTRTVSPATAAEHLSTYVSQVKSAMRWSPADVNFTVGYNSDRTNAADQFEEYIPYDLAASEIDHEPGSFGACEPIDDCPARVYEASPRKGISISDLKQIPGLASFYHDQIVGMEVVSDPSGWLDDRCYDIELALCGTAALEPWRDFVELARVLTTEKESLIENRVEVQVVDSSANRDIRSETREVVLLFAGFLDDIGDQMKGWSHALVDVAGPKNAEIARIPSVDERTE